MINYSKDLLKILQENSVISESFGSEITLKPVPDIEGTALDPREKALYLRHLNSNHRPAQTLQDHRDDTGFPGLNLNTKTILTDKLTLNCDGYDFTVWEYRLRRTKRQGDAPALLYIHGGSFFAGSAQYMENLCKYICEEADCVVYNIEYSLAPERPFPKGLNDCLCTLNFVYENAEALGIDKNKICISGDSAGAGIAAATALNKGKDKIRYMALLYPCVLLDTEAPFEWKEEDFAINEDEKSLVIPRLSLGRTDGKADMTFMTTIGHMYLSTAGDLRHDPQVSPIYADFTGAPKTTVITADYDGLRPQGEYFCAKLRESGADARCIRYRGVFHAFAEKTGYLPQAQDALYEIAKDINSL
ncbi:MAG: alpha/beta hydrolase [Ruminococcus sp.]|nr:alpha/beta hydrolase [Ruminococcus sp.]